jgi:hypothetical protein
MDMRGGIPHLEGIIYLTLKLIPCKNAAIFKYILKQYP